MVVKVKLRLSTDTKSIDVIAIANSGFESDDVEIIVPVSVAKSLGFYPELPEGTVIEYYEAAGRRRFKTYRLKKGLVKAYVVTEDRIVGPIDIVLTVVPREKDVLISDKALDAFGIVLIKPGEGIWKFIDDKPEVFRRSIQE